jgi:hypothetical protein
MTGDDWQGPRRWSRIAIAGGLLAVSLFGVALGIGLTQPQSRGGQSLPLRVYQPFLPAGSCHSSTTSNGVSTVVCIGARVHIGGGSLPAHIAATRAAIIRAFKSQYGHGTGSVTITATRYPRNFGWLATKGWIGLQGLDGTHWFKVPSSVALHCHLESQATSDGALLCVVSHLTPAERGSGPL